MCVLIEQSLETVCTSGSKIREGPMEFGTKNIKLESRELVKACENSLKGAQKLAEDSLTSTITHRVSILSMLCLTIISITDFLKKKHFCS